MWQLAIYKEKCLLTLDGPFSVPYLPVFALSFGVYSFSFTWLWGETALEHVGACAGRGLLLPRTLVSNMSFLSGERERNPQHCILWGVYRYSSWSGGTAIVIIPGTWVASQPASAAGFNIDGIWFGDFFLDRQITKSKISLNFPTTRLSVSDNRLWRFLEHSFLHCDRGTCLSLCASL